jgi:hypothetical protein
VTDHKLYNPSFSANIMTGYDGDRGEIYVDVDSEGRLAIRNSVWNPSTLAWEAMNQPIVSADSLTVSGVMDLTKIGGVAVGAGNGLYVRPGTGAVFATKDEYKLSDMDSTGDPSYYGYVDADGAWFIMELNTGLGTARYIKGANNYTTNWTGRAGLTYDYYHNIF